MVQSTATRRARGLRREMSPPELLLWLRLRKPTPGAPRFRRQHPFGRLTLDFYCAAARLDIEVDGGQHFTDDGPERDARRDAWVRSQGLEVVRVLSSEVMADADGVAEWLIRLAEERIAHLPPSHALRARQPPSFAGGR